MLSSAREPITMPGTEPTGAADHADHAPGIGFRRRHEAARVGIVCDHGAGADAVTGGEIEDLGVVVHVLAVDVDVAVPVGLHT